MFKAVAQLKKQLLLLKSVDFQNAFPFLASFKDPQGYSHVKTYRDVPSKWVD